MNRRHFMGSLLLAIPFVSTLKSLFARERAWTFSNRLQLSLRPDVIADSNEFPSKLRIYVPRNLKVSCKEDTSFYIYFSRDGEIPGISWQYRELDFDGSADHIQWGRNSI